MMLVAVFDMDCNRDLNTKTTFGFDSDFGFNRDLNMDFDRDANSHFNNDFTIDVNNGLNNDFNFDFYEEFDRDILTLILMEGGWILEHRGRSRADARSMPYTHIQCKVNANSK